MARPLSISSFVAVSGGARRMALSPGALAGMRLSPSSRLRLQRRSEEHTSELQSLMRISYAVFCLKKKKNTTTLQSINNQVVTFLSAASLMKHNQYKTQHV